MLFNSHVISASSISDGESTPITSRHFCYNDSTLLVSLICLILRLCVYITRDIRVTCQCASFELFVIMRLLTYIFYVSYASTYRCYCKSNYTNSTTNFKYCNFLRGFKHVRNCFSYIPCTGSVTPKVCFWRKLHF